MRTPLRSRHATPAERHVELAIGQAAELSSPRCGAESVLGHRCQEPLGHSGAHRDPRAEITVRWGADHEPVEPPILSWGP